MTTPATAVWPRPASFKHQISTEREASGMSAGMAREASGLAALVAAGAVQVATATTSPSTLSAVALQVSKSDWLSETSHSTETASPG